jgi:hypothetical protein
MTVLCSPKFKSRLRLQAAISLLHLSTVEVYANAISPAFVSLAITVQVRALYLVVIVANTVNNRTAVTMFAMCS